MKKSLAKKITLSILAGAVLFSTSSVWAAVTTPPPGDGWTKGDFVVLDIWHTNSEEIKLSSGTGTTTPITSAYGNDSVATGGKLTITGGSVSNWIHGGYENGTGTAKQNTVTISDGDFTSYIYGGYSRKGAANENTVTISGGEFSYSSIIYGGDSYEGDATNNTVTISGGDFTGSIYGGRSWNGNANENTVNISGGKFNGQDIYGGYAYGKSTNTPDDYGANRNTVEINGASAGSTFGDIYGGWTENGNANENIVTLYDGTFAGMVAGGSTGTSNGGAIGNTVTISGDANVKNADLYGGVKDYGSSGGYYAWYAYDGRGYEKPNILTIGTDKYSWRHLHNTSDYNVKSIQGFDEIVFEHVKWDTENPAVKVSALQLDSREGTKITVNNLYVAGDDETFKANAKMTLIDSAETTGYITSDSDVAKIHRGVARIYEAEIVYEGNTGGPNSPKY